MSGIQDKKGYIIDMDGVIYHGNVLLPGAAEFVSWLKEEQKKFLFLTNNSGNSPRDLKQKMQRLGLEIEEEHFYTSALATAAFIKSQKYCASAYVIGDAGLVGALYDAGISINDVSPDYVIIGETRNYNFDNISKAVHLVMNGSKLIATNSDLSGPSENGIIPACRALVAPVELVSGRQAYYIGKPNPLMMRTGLRILGCKPEDTAIIGDRMDTDIVAGLESEIDTVLVLSGVTSMKSLKKFSYQPTYVFEGIGEIIKAG
jgi:NagD protein